jgi:hypothetical protein
MGLALGFELFPERGDKLTGTVVGSVWVGCGVVFQQDVQPSVFAFGSQGTALHPHAYRAFADTQCYGSITDRYAALVRTVHFGFATALSHARKVKPLGTGPQAGTSRPRRSQGA